MCMTVRATPPCFTALTLIRTPDGEVPISQLAQGDLVMTADNGAHLVRWIRCTLRPAAVLSRRPGFRPVRILRGAFGANRPIRDTS